MDEEYRIGSVHTSVLCSITCGDSVGLEDLFTCLIDLYSLIPRSLAGLLVWGLSSSSCGSPQGLAQLPRGMIAGI